MAKHKYNTHKIISVKKARLHNLKDVSVDIPRNALTVITGVSGSGKSSLAFDTVYAEGQRRFVESLSSYARQFLERMHKPDVDSIDGLPPAIAIEQRKSSKNPRSTVGTTTEVYDYLRLLYGRIGITICKQCGKEIRKDTPDSVAGEIGKWDEGDKIFILFGIDSHRDGFERTLKTYREQGYFRVLQKDSNDIINLEHDSLPESLDNKELFLLIDRLVVNSGDEDFRTRLNDSIETAFVSGGGKIIVRNISKGIERDFSSDYECTSCDIIYIEPEPRLFSFNNPYGACPNCQGFGRTIGIDDNLVFPDRSKSINQGAIHPFRTHKHSKYQRELLKVAPVYKIPLDTPIHNLSEEQINIIMDGVPGYLGVNGFFSMLEEKFYKIQNRVLMSRYRGYTKCRACNGSRLRTSARQTFVGPKNLPDLIKLPLDKVLDYIIKLELSDYHLAVAGQVLSELKWRLELLVEIGLEYLTLERLTHTLSGGEAQRINLSTALGSSLVGTLYVLDEPSIGMHPKDTLRLINILFKLRNLGNTIIVVEHDLDIIEKADYIIDIGPKAGEYGGEIVFSGKYSELIKSKESLTGKYISGKVKLSLPEEYKAGNGKAITVVKPAENNLKIDKVRFPLGCMTVVTGVSGSGKSTLVHSILYSGIKKSFGGFHGSSGTFERIDGIENIDHVELVDQSPIGRSSRSTPATYTKTFDIIRTLFTQTQAARQMGWRPGHFSFNVPGGRCEVCEGEGTVTVDMQFLPDVHLECESCKGTRFRREIRNLFFNGKSIVDVLAMTVDEAMDFFVGYRKVAKKLQILQDVGLGYLRLGQPSTMLSGGEAQRIKLANHLESSYKTNAIFIFDEPTTGLHIDDVSKLLQCFNRLVNKGHTVIIIEHNLHVIASADWVIDLGPGAGEKGGKLVARGTPLTVSNNVKSFTGQALKEFFEKFSG